MDRNLGLEMIRVTEAAALASARWMGKGDAKAADQTATQAMHQALQDIYFKGTIIIGKGTQNETDFLYSGEVIGRGENFATDIVCDPLESTKSVAFGRANALAVIAIAPEGSFVSVPDVYMTKYAVGADAAEAIDMRLPLEENVQRVAKAKNYRISDLTIVMLDRKRHIGYTNRLRKLGTRIHLIPDGDVSAAIATALPGTGIDMLVGSGGAAEGVISAAALRCLGGELNGQFVVQNTEDEIKLKDKGFDDYNKIYKSAELAKGENIMCAATGITDGDLLNGVRYRSDGATTNSLAMRSMSRTRRFFTTEHFFDNQPNY